MRYLRTAFLFFISILFLHSCSCGCGGGSGRSGALRIGVDPNWYPIDFGSQEAYVNGFTEELLLEVARYSGLEFERLSANWDTLLDGLNGKKYDAVLTSLPPYDFNVAKYDFSQNFLDLGPVLVVPVDAQHTDLNKMGGELVGLVTGDPSVLVLSQHPDIILRNYPTIPDLLNAIVNGEIEAAVLNQIPAVSFVGDLYAGQLKIVGTPMTEAGLHLITSKGKNQYLMNHFNKALDQLKKKKKLQTLLQKWELAE